MLPDEIDFATGAALGLAGTAAVGAIDAAKIDSDTVVLITGATGGVGQQALQLAVQAGATVIATAGTEQGKSLVSDLGATNVVDYQQDTAAQVVQLHPEGVDVVLNFAGDPAALVPTVKQGGRLASTLIMSPDAVEADGIEILPVYADPTSKTLSCLAKNQAEQYTAVTIQQMYSLEHIPQAISDFSAGTRGKLVITLD